MKLKDLILIFTNIAFFLLYSCGASIKIWNGGDLQAPELVSIQVLSEKSFFLEYNEAIASSSVELSISDDIEVESILIEKQIVRVIVQQDMIAGNKYTITSKVSDIKDNYSIAIDNLYGFNAHIPKLLINEFICEGSKTRPDKVELYVLESGNLAGITLREGALNFSKEVVFPNIEVLKGDYIVVHWIAEPRENYVNDLTSKTDSTHPQAYDTAWDIFNPVPKGISNTNASLSIVNLANNEILDAVVYSVKEDDLDHKYRGFSSSKSFIWAEELAAYKAWTIQSTETGIVPSDTVNPKDSTTTRSIGRNTLHEDTDSASDWHIAASSKSSFGENNTDEYYK